MPRRFGQSLAPVGLMLAGFTSWATAAHAERLRTLDPERVREAIAFGETAPEGALAQYELERVQGYLVNCDTPFLRVAQLARAMKTTEASLDDEEVSPRLAADVLHFYLHPQGDGEDEPPPRVESIVLEGPLEKGSGERLIAPLSLQAPRRRASAGSEAARGSRPSPVKAVFPMSALAPDTQLTIRFADGTVQRLRLDRDWLDHLR